MSHHDQAGVLVGVLRRTVDAAASSLARRTAQDGPAAATRLDQHQTLAYELASLASAVSAAERLLDFGVHGEHEAALAHAFAADVHADLCGRAAGRWELWGVDREATGLESAEFAAAAREGRDSGLLSAIATKVLRDGEASPRHLGEELQMVRDAFRRFAEERVMPIAEQVHRRDADIPDTIIDELASMGCFALTIPARHGGVADGGDDELLNMVVVTEELSRGSLGVAGSLVTRPEIIATAIAKGGTDEQMRRWLPMIAAGEKMCAVAVTEPDHGSDVAALKTTATRDGDDWVINGVKTWCTFAGRAEYLLVLARTDPDRAKGHRGLSLFVVEKPRHDGHEFRVEQESSGGAAPTPAGLMEGRAIPTIGYRGMHSFEISFEGWRVPHANLIGEDDGEGQGFYLQMHAFDNARLQTAARALGVMQAALDEAVAYARQRTVFDRPLADYGLTRSKIARMALLIAASRAFAVDVARELARGGGRRGASEVKQFACRAAEWVTREAQQLHGGYGYAEEYTVSRLFLDARVLSIFEGTDEVLAVRVIAKRLLAEQRD